MSRQSCNAIFILFVDPYPFLFVTAMVIIISGSSFLFPRNIVLDVIQIIQFGETLYGKICEHQSLSYSHQEVQNFHIIEKNKVQHNLLSIFPSITNRSYTNIMLLVYLIFKFRYNYKNKFGCFSSSNCYILNFDQKS